MTRLRSSGDDSAAGAHTERICSPAVLGVAGELIIGRAEGGMPRKRAVLRLIYKLSRVLDTHADRERLLNYIRALIINHFDGIAGGMPYAEQQGISLDILCAAVVHAGDALHNAVCDYNIGQSAVEAHLTAEGNYLLTESLNYSAETVGAYMRP